MVKNIHAVFSYAGNRNFGDDYILSEWIKYSEAAQTGKKLFISTDSTWMQSQHIDDNVVFNTVFPATIYPFVQDWKKANLGQKMSISDCIRTGWKAADHFVGQLEWRRTLQRISAFHLIGGGYLNKLFPQAHGAAAFMQRMSQHLGVPFYATGLGLLPTEDGNAELEELFAGFTFIECRDINSYEFLRQHYPSAKAILGADDTFLTPVRTVTQPNRKPVIFINVQSDLSAHSHESLAKRMKDFCEEAGHNYNIQYIHFFQNSDAVFYNRVHNDLRITQSYDKDQLYDAGLPFQKGDICISSRFHMHVLASRAGARGAYIVGHTGYYDIKHASMVNIGSNWVSLMDKHFAPETLLAAPEPSIDEVGLRIKKEALAKVILG